MLNYYSYYKRFEIRCHFDHRRQSSNNLPMRSEKALIYCKETYLMRLEWMKKLFKFSLSFEFNTFLKIDLFSSRGTAFDTRKGFPIVAI